MHIKCCSSHIICSRRPKRRCERNLLGRFDFFCCLQESNQTFTSYWHSLLQDAVKVLEKHQPHIFRASCNRHIYVAAGNIKFGRSPQSPPTWQPRFKAHMYHINNFFYHLESVHLSHLTHFLILRLRLTKQAKLAALEARAEAEPLEQKSHTEAHLAVKSREATFPVPQQRVRSLQGNVWACTNWSQKTYFLESLLVYSPPPDTDIELNPLCRKENFLL